ncbi:MULTISPECIES: hypothetical protein [unclassified Streptomyces]|uniref:hypothetical protein n=1 Tax=unclassified Streptomyces TaxID=2593676 RepID=UPI0038078492
MRYSDTDRQAVGFLLGLADEDTAERIRARTGLPRRERPRASRARMGHVLFPARVRDAEDALRPLVRDHLGGREEAWAVLAQLIGTFHGTAPELVTAAGAIA